MRIIFTFLSFFVISFLQAQELTGKTAGLNIVPANAVAKKDSGQRIVLRCGFARYTDRQPLLVVDGEIKEMETISSIDHGDIEEIFILKDASATAIYGCRATMGVIIVTTKSSKIREFIIKDFLRGSAIPAASIRFIRQPLQKDTLHFVSNDSGFISTNKLVVGGKYEAIITSTGYKPLNVKFNTGYINKQVILLLEKDARGSVYKDDETVQKVASASPVTIFPNPVTRGQSFTIQTGSGQQRSLQAIITDFSGKTVLQQNFSAAKGVNRFTVNTDSRWSAGVHLLLWKNEKGIVLQTQQIVVR